MHPARLRWSPAAACALAAALLFTLALAVRLPATRWGLPYLYPWDEAQVAHFSIRMAEERDVNPRVFLYPSLALYVYAAADAVALRRGAPAGALPTGSPLWRQTAADEWNVPHTRLLHLHRVITAVVGSLLAAVVLVLGARLGVPAGGFVGGVLVAVSPAMAAGSARTSVDPWMALFAALSLIPLTSAAPGRGARLASAALSGMAAACKYPAGIVLLPALWLATRERPHAPRAVLEVLGVCAAAFLVCSPFVLLDARTALRDIAFEVWMYGVAGHPGAEHGRGLGNLLFHLGHVVGALGPVGWLAPLGAWWLVRRARGGAAMLTFATAYLLFMSLQRVAAARNMDPVVVLAAVCAGAGAEWLVRHVRVPAPALTVVMLAWLLALERGFALAPALERWGQPDSRVVATRWLALEPQAPGAVAAELHVHGEQLHALPPGTRVAPADSARAWLQAGRVAWALLPAGQGPPTEAQFAAFAPGTPGPPRLELSAGQGRERRGPPVDPALELWVHRAAEAPR